MAFNPDILEQGELHALREAAERAWGDDTRQEAYAGARRPSAGQCYNTSRWLMDRLGGSVGRIHGHYVWLSPDHTHAIDLTGDQFGQDQILYKPTDHHLFAGVEPVQPEDLDDESTQRMIVRANREYDNLGSKESALVKKYADLIGDSHPAQEPQATADREQRYLHHAPMNEDSKGEYKFVFANGQLEVSPFHDHEELASQAGVDLDSSGPLAAGYISVDLNMANFSVASNIGAKLLSKELKEYAERVGWKWGGMTDLEGEPVGTGSEFAPKKTYRWRFADGHLYVGERDDDLVRESASGNFENNIFGACDLIKLPNHKFVSITSLSKGSAVFFSTKQAKQQLEDFIVAMREWADDQGMTLTSSGIGGGNNVIKTIEDLEVDNIYTPTPQNMDEHQFFPRIDERQPGGVYKCPHCDRICPTWRDYQAHSADHEDIGAEPIEEGNFPEVDMDATHPTHFTEQQPQVMPVASVKEARRAIGFRTVAKALGFDNDKHVHYVAYQHGCPVGWLSVDGEGEVKGARAEIHPRWVTRLLTAAAQKHYPRLTWHELSHIPEPYLKDAGFMRVAKDTWKYAAGKEPRDMIEDDVPFIYDVEGDHIAVGHPGTHTSDIPGKFTPGGIVEGTYEQGGKVFIRSMTNMPYTVRHMIQLWYAEHPQLEVKSVHLRDEEGKDTKLAKKVAIRIEEVSAPPMPKSKIRGLEKRRPFKYNEEEDAVYIGPPGSHHGTMDAPFGRAGYVMDDGEVGDLEGNPPEVLRAIADHFGPSHYVNEGETWKFEGAVDPVQTVLLSAAKDPAADLAKKALQMAGGRVFAVGGAVRDAVMGKEPKDIDLMVQGIPAEEVEQALKQLPGRVDYTGKDFGVFRYREKGNEVEIALPRKERSTGDAHKDFDVQADHTMSPEEDLYRRDFTANAMAVDLGTGEFLDPYNGAGDIDSGTLKTVHEHALAEDPLRVVRALTAHGKHGLHPNEGTRAQMTANAQSIEHLPQERVQAELDKIMASDDPAAAIRLAHETGALQHILPEVDEAFGFDQNNPHHELELGEHLLSVLERTAQVTNDPDVRLAALLHDIGKPASAWEDPETGTNHFYQGPEGQGANHEDVGAEMASSRMKSLRYPNDRAMRVRDLVQHHMFPAFKSPKGARRYLNRVGDHADDLLDIRWADQGGKSEYPTDPTMSIDEHRRLIDEVRQGPAPTQLSQLAINGKDLIDAGIKPGPELGSILDGLLQETLENPELNDRETLLGMIPHAS